MLIKIESYVESSRLRPAIMSYERNNRPKCGRPVRRGVLHATKNVEAITCRAPMAAL